MRNTTTTGKEARELRLLAQPDGVAIVITVPAQKTPDAGAYRGCDEALEALVCRDCGTEDDVHEEWELNEGIPLCYDCNNSTFEGRDVPPEWRFDGE